MTVTQGIFSYGVANQIMKIAFRASLFRDVRKRDEVVGFIRLDNSMKALGETVYASGQYHLFPMGWYARFDEIELQQHGGREDW